MSTISEQKVVVLCDFSERMNGTILHGICLASFLKKELCLLAFAAPKEKKTALHDRLEVVARLLKEKTGGLPVSSLVLKGNLEQKAELLTNKYDAVIVIMNRRNLSAKLRALPESTIPFLLVEGKESDRLTYRQVMLPVDFRKEMKETSLWASYFGRFNKAAVQVLGAVKGEPENLHRVKKNVVFIAQFLSDLKVACQVAEGRSGSWKIQFEALSIALKNKTDVLIILGSKNISPLDMLIGLPEKKIIRRAGLIPVLCVNPGKNLNILCD